MFGAYIVLRRQAFGGVFSGGAAAGSNPAAKAGTVTVWEVPASRSLATLCGISGLLTTLFAMLMSLVPPPEGALLYELKVLGGAGVFVAAGAILYWRNH
jgi:hypothetical protein